MVWIFHRLIVTSFSEAGKCILPYFFQGFSRSRGRIYPHKVTKSLKLAERTETCFPDGVPPQDCHLSHTRPVWRLEKGRAVLVAYAIYRGPKNQYSQIPGALGRSEFGMEIIVEIAYFVYVIGLSFDKVCLTLQFLQNLPLGKTQADSLLKQIGRASCRG